MKIDATKNKSICIVGPFASEYSLAKMNRNLAHSLAEANPDLKVQIWAEPSQVDRMPSKADLKRYPFLEDLITYERPEPDILIYNNFPKSVYGLYGFKELPGKVKLAYLGWEETVFPKRWVDECNKYLHGLLVISEHVKKVFRASGVAIPIQVVSLGLDIPYTKSEPYTLKTQKHFKFFHNSSGQFRKGVDLLLRAYFAEFKNSDDVCLVLKLFPNASLDKQIDELIAGRASNAPEVEVIKTDNISDGQIKSLYEQCSAVVLPTRAEGFGLPMAEAMVLGKPLITTAYSGQMDFCNEANSYLIGYKLVESTSHLNIPGAKIAEPDFGDLKMQMSYLFKNIHSSVVHNKTTLAKTRASELTWENAAQQISAFIKEVEFIAPLKSKKMAVVTTLNSRCGIAIYSSDMYPSITSAFKEFRFLTNSDIGDRVAPDKDDVRRVWTYGDPDFENLIKEIEDYHPDFIHFQYNLSFYSPKLLGKAVIAAKDLNIETYVTLHSIHPTLQASIADLNKADAVFVHSTDDLDTLKKMGLKNCQFTTHGLIPYKNEPQAELVKKYGITNTPVLASFGMIHDKKGLLELLAAVKILKKDYPKLLLLAINALNPNNSSSAAVYNQMKTYIADNDLEASVILISDYLKSLEIIKLIQLSQLAILPYGDVVEGASGAVRTVIGAKRPMITSDAYIFRNLALGFKIKGNKPEAIANGVKELLNNPKLYKRISSELEEYANNNNWETLSYRYLHDLADTLSVSKS